MAAGQALRLRNSPSARFPRSRGSLSIALRHETKTLCCKGPRNRRSGKPLRRGNSAGGAKRCREARPGGARLRGSQRAGPPRSSGLRRLITCCWRGPDWLRGNAGSGKRGWEPGDRWVGMGEPGGVAGVACREWERTLGRIHHRGAEGARAAAR